MDNRLGIIDLGSNTFHLLIVEAKEDYPFYKEIYRERQFIYLAYGGIENIDEEKEMLALKCLESFRAKLDYFSCHNIKAIGTAALRSAENGLDFLKKIELKTGIVVELISGEEEARLIYEGCSFLELESGTTNMIMDIGGGSVEFIIEENKEVVYSASHKIGISVLRSQFQFSDPIGEEEMNVFFNYLDDNLKALNIQLNKYKPKLIIGSSGPFEILESIMNDTPRSRGNLYSREQYKSVSSQILEASLSERENIEGMPDFRADLSKESFLLIEYFMKSYKSFENLLVSPYAIKEGIIAEWVK